MDNITKNISFEVKNAELLEEIKYAFKESKMQDFEEFMNMILQSYFIDMDNSTHIIHLLNNLTNATNILISKLN